MMHEGYEIRRVRSSPFGPPSGQQPVLVSRFSSPARPSVIDGPTTLHPGQRKSGAILTTCAPCTHEKAQAGRASSSSSSSSSSRLEPRLPLKYGLGCVCLPPIMRIVRTLSVDLPKAKVQSETCLATFPLRATSDLETALNTGTSANANELSLLNVLGALHRGDRSSP
ncbi:hypothetical protein HZH68_000060 [Vespula germanica]|uniref:Uncharacterized protein n=1 Tax=Vespula germanica TaxID=30212 RepID=A0A834U5N2_VESGE|nr:hypothetical protein HZH68_000060 [Vespula germanica]